MSTTSRQETLIGKVGRVTGQVRTDCLGEVTVSIRGGTQAYHARAYDSVSQYELDERVVVVDFQPPLTVYVSSLN